MQELDEEQLKQLFKMEDQPNEQQGQHGEPENQSEDIFASTSSTILRHKKPKAQMDKEHNTPGQTWIKALCQEVLRVHRRWGQGGQVSCCIDNHGLNTLNNFILLYFSHNGQTPKKANSKDKKNTPGHKISPADRKWLFTIFEPIGAASANKNMGRMSSSIVTEELKNNEGFSTWFTKFYEDKYGDKNGVQNAKNTIIGSMATLFKKKMLEQEGQK